MLHTVNVKIIIDKNSCQYLHLANMGYHLRIQK